MESRVTTSWSNCLAQGPRDKYIYPGPACSKRCFLLLINNILSQSLTRNITLRSITLYHSCADPSGPRYSYLSCFHSEYIFKVL
ncbi:hypothetical protein VTN00DRAFT_8675 [Thermoascus crustaceus]|uniref:uncharacterized protein n=1 Tax=Thermoascus crustaceus TaxID=5088 RepID=UPI00374329B6